MKQKGFTIIELMLVIAIVGILATMAVPAYQDYVIKARVTEGMSLATAARMAVTETMISTNTLPADQAAVGYESPPSTANVHSVVIGGQGIITVTYTPAAGDGSLVLKPTLTDKGELSWSCTGGTLLPKYRPANCRG